MILGASILQLPAIEKAQDMGLQVIAVDFNPQAVGFNVPGVIKEVISTIDTPSILNAANKHQIDAIMTLATDMPIRSVAIIAKELGLNGIDFDTAVKATNKAKMRSALREAGVPIPRFFKVTNEDEYLNSVRKINAPFVIKPTDSSGSRGIYKVQDIYDEKVLREAYEYCLPFSIIGEMIVEEYMSGPEVSVETLSIDGDCHVIQITDKLTTGAPHFVEIGHSQPTKHDKEIEERIKEVAIAANKAIGIKNGPSHTEIIITSEGPKIVEVGARLGGDCITTHLVPLSTGVNMVECCIRIALGEKPNIESQWNKGSAIRYFHQESGIVKSIKGYKQAEKIPGVEQITIVHGIGEEVTEINNSGSRVGFVITQGENAKDAIEKCNRAIEMIKIEFYRS